LVCNGKKDCADGSDELKCDVASCKDKLDPKQVCDGVGDCGDQSDEAGCVYVCKDQSNKYEQTQVCDAVLDCKDGSDELNCPFWLCKDSSSKIDKKQVCDGVPNCKDKSDELDCPAPFVCKDESNKIDQKQVCDGFPDCKDQSDEANCEPPAPFVCQNKKLVPPELVCNDKDDCGDNSDEADCKENICHAGVDQAPRFDDKLGCWLPPVVIGCATLIDPDKSVPSYWPTSTCLHRKSDGALFLVPEPQLATEWQDCSKDELAKIESASFCK